MKSILLPVENHALAGSCLETAWQIARRCESQVSAYALRPVHYQVVGAEPIVAGAPITSPDEALRCRKRGSGAANPPGKSRNRAALRDP